MKRFWRRVWVYDLYGQRWDVHFDEQVPAWDAFDCRWTLSWCVSPQPYVYEQWWSFTPSTIGTSPGSYRYLGARINWGANPEV